MTETAQKPWPTELRVTQKGSVLAVTFDTGAAFELAAEYLRVESPSAEVKGHGPGQETTVAGKKNVTVLNVEAIGNYAARITFSDGHATGLFSWEYLHKLGMEYDTLWPAYRDKLKTEGLSREPG